MTFFNNITYIYLFNLTFNTWLIFYSIMKALLITLKIKPTVSILCVGPACQSKFSISRCPILFVLYEDY